MQKRLIAGGGPDRVVAQAPLITDTVGMDNTPLGIYIHVPFCTLRCGYCDFNTYVPEGPGQQSEFVDAALLEIAHARAELGDRRVSTVFIGGGTPSLLGAAELVRLLDAVAGSFGLVEGAEVTTEANPESVSAPMFRDLLAGGFTRISLGMQSASPHVLAALERQHTAGRAVAAAAEARDAGFEHLSLDLIYGTAGESDADWDATLSTGIEAATDHLSCYALTVEPGTALAAAVRRGSARAPSEEVQARRFIHTDERLSEAGFQWYEISSWARGPEGQCRHNLGYWASHDWWGIGPGAHSHLKGVRWWNVLRPGAYVQRLNAGKSPIAEREVLTPEQRAMEALLLGLRSPEGIEIGSLGEPAREKAQQQVDRGRAQVSDGRMVLTREGRLFADGIALELSD